MPIWLRRFTFDRIKTAKQKENEANTPKDSKKTELNLFNPQQEFKKANTSNPDYISKASKK